jgi:preprotein translocase SecE subunit
VSKVKQVADEKKKKIRQVKPVTAKKPKASMRAQAAKSRADADKPKRVRQAAGAAKKPVSAFGKALTTEYHVLSRGNNGFFTKSRTLTPGYLRKSWQELKQVSWPGRKETWRLVFAVFVFALALGAMIAVLDYGLEKLLREVIL